MDGIEGFEIDYWYPDDAHEGFQQWPEAGSEDLEEEAENEDATSKA